MIRRIGSSVVAAGILCALAIATVGMPTVAPTAKDRSTPFPCMDSPCGCRDAESCWRSCCCHSNVEKIAWAREHGVTPPDYVLAAAAREQQQPVRACCAARAAKAKLASRAAAVEKPQATPEAAATPVRVRVVTLAAYGACKGLDKLCQLLSHSLDCRGQRVVAARPEAGEWLLPSSVHAAAGSLPPAVPPPEPAAV